MPQILHCSFCRKSEDEVRKLVAGPNVYICDSCVKIAADIMEHSGPPDPTSPRARTFFGRLRDRLFRSHARFAWSATGT